MFRLILEHAERDPANVFNCGTYYRTGIVSGPLFFWDAGDCHVVLDVDEHRGFHEVARFETIRMTLATNQHLIRVEGEFGRLTIEVANVPSENPRTGRLSYLSTIALLRDLGATLRVGT